MAWIMIAQAKSDVNTINLDGSKLEKDVTKGALNSHKHHESISVLLEPHPLTVTTKLFERRKYMHCGCQFNMIACTWIQFMFHDWNDHMEDTEQVELRAPQDIVTGYPFKSFKFLKTKKLPTDKDTFESRPHGVISNSGCGSRGGAERYVGRGGSGVQKHELQSISIIPVSAVRVSIQFS
ncbi:hypothetical protein P3L10_032561 [Capsicum annuum]